MDIGKYIGENLMLWMIIGIIILLVFMPLLRRFRNLKLLKTVTSLTRGTKTERNLVLKLLKHGIPAQTIFHDLCLKRSNDKFSQIDVALATTEGIIVFEVKDYSGWIFGNGNYSHWTKVLAYGKRKYRFYNPIKQNKNHIETLRKQLVQFENIPFYSIIVFYGDCELKEINYVPQGTYLVKPNRIFEVLKLIRENNDPAPYTNKSEIVNVLEQAVINGEELETQEKHVEDIHDMVGKHRIFD
ncbi:NERD domain-containing protein [Ancylomarina sp. DW003]|nr:nuclease-related domain-containing protein [Ancylomarina sp. DW003]MDE5423679.1 NERD domain-containing protein [Ancylomarina sp. DW003]